MGNFMFLDPRRYDLWGRGQNPALPGAIATPPFVPIDAAQMPPAGVQPQAPQVQQPARSAGIMPAISNALMMGINAAATPNIAGGGATDVMRGISNARNQAIDRNAALQNLEIQRQQQARANAATEAQMEENRAQAEWYRNRADAAMRPKPVAAVQPKLVQDKAGNWANPYTGEIVRPAAPAAPAVAGPTIPVGIGQTGVIGDYAPPLSVQVADPIAGGEKTLDFPAWGKLAELPVRDATSVINAGVAQQNAARPRESILSGSTADGRQVATVIRRGPNGEVTQERVETGVYTRAPRQSGGATSTRTPGPNRTAMVDTFINRLMSDAQTRGVSTEDAIKAAQNMNFYTDVPAAIKLEAVARMKRQVGKQRGPAGPPALPGASPAPQPQKTATRTEVAQYAQQKGISPAAAEQALTQAGYVIR